MDDCKLTGSHVQFQFPTFEFDLAASSNRPAVPVRVGGSDRPIDGADANGSIEVPPGTSIHHFDLAPKELPEEADLDQTEIGPGGILRGG